MDLVGNAELLPPRIRKSESIQLIIMMVWEDTTQRESSRTNSILVTTVWIPHGWLTPNVGVLTGASQDIDRLTGMVLQFGVAMDLRAAGPDS